MITPRAALILIFIFFVVGYILTIPKKKEEVKVNELEIYTQDDIYYINLEKNTVRTEADTIVYTFENEEQLRNFLAERTSEETKPGTL